MIPHVAGPGLRLPRETVILLGGEPAGEAPDHDGAEKDQDEREYPYVSEGEAAPDAFDHGTLPQGRGSKV